MVPARHHNTLAAVMTVISFCVFTIASPNAMAGDDHVHLEAHLQPGQIFRYQMNLQTSATSRSEGPITDPQGATRLDRQAMATVRLEVVRITPVESTGNRVRLRVTFEHCTANSQSDALDVEEHEFQDQFRKLQGSSLEFDLEPDGKTDNFSASQQSPDAKVTPEQTAPQQTVPQQPALDPWVATMMQQSTGALASPGGLPHTGISVGDKWSAEREFDPAPLTGLYWRTDSTYVRNEPCPHASPELPQKDSAIPASPAGAATSGNTAKPETCAVIQADLHLLSNRKKGADQTPPDYLQNGLHTAGDWNGIAESVSDIALGTGMVVTMTQKGSQDMDFRVASARGQTSLRYQGHVESALGVTLLP